MARWFLSLLLGLKCLFDDNWYQKKKLAKISEEFESQFEENTIQSI